MSYLERRLFMVNAERAEGGACVCELPFEALDAREAAIRAVSPHAQQTREKFHVTVYPMGNDADLTEWTVTVECKPGRK